MTVHYHPKKSVLRSSLWFVGLLLSLLNTAIYAQNNQMGTIKGRVKTSDGRPAEFINVILENTNRGTVTDTEGYYLIENVSPGRHVVVVSHLGLETRKVTVLVQPNKATLVEEMVLSETSQKLQEIVVTDHKVNAFSVAKSAYVARMPLNKLENPQVYSVINNALMEEQQITSVQDALQNTPGINSVVQSLGSGGVGLSLNLRGFGSDITMRNGMATNYVTMSDPVNLERLEVIKGPSATLFGSTLISYGGLVNRVTKKPHNGTNGAIGYSFGSFGLSRFTLDFNAPLKSDESVLFRINAARHNENSFQDYGRTRNWAFTPAVVVKASDRLTLSLETEIYHTQLPTSYFSIASGVTAENFNELSYDFEHSYSSDQLQSQADVFNVFASATYELSDNWVSQTNISTANTDNQANYLFLTFLDNSQVRRMPMNIVSNFSSKQIQQNFIGDFNIGTVHNKLLVGLDYYGLSTSDRRVRYVYDTVSYENPDVDFNMEEYESTLGNLDPYVRYKRKTNTYSAYLSDVVNITDVFSVMASLRIDYFDNEAEDYDQTALSPKFGMVYQVVKEKVSLFANYMDGFQNVAPSENDENQLQIFDPEHATQLEGGLKTNLFDGKLNATLSYYDITVRNIVRSVQDDLGNTVSVQDGTRMSKGVELELVANPVEGWNILAGYGYNDSEYTKAEESVEGHRPYSTPENSFNFWTSYQIPVGTIKGLGVGFGGNYVDEAYFNDANTFMIPSYTILNASVYYDHRDFRAGIKLNNLTDEEYWTSSYYASPQKTRNVVINFTYKF